MSSVVLDQTAAPPVAVSLADSFTSTSFSARDISVDLLVPSKTNPRKAFDKGLLDELADSIRANGIIEPIVVRVCGHGVSEYEIVCGERRWRAAKVAKLKTVPCVIKELSDREAIEIQVVENQQREDVSPLEEGRGYQALVDQLFAERTTLAETLVKGNHVTRDIIVEEVGKRIGKKKRYVYQRMQLAAKLSEPVKKALEAGQISASHADEIVRLQPADQERALNFCLVDNNYGQKVKREQPPTIKQVRKFLTEETFVDLADAPFSLDDEKLLPVAGACKSCPKLASNDPLFAKGEVKPNTCTDPECYQQKKLATINVNVEELRQKRGVDPVLISDDWSPANNKREKGVIYRHEYGTDGYAAGNNSHAPVKEGDCDFTKLAIYVDGEKVGKTVWICHRGEKQCSVHGYHSTGSGSREDEAKKRKAVILQKDFRARVFKQVAEKLKKPEREDLDLVAFEFFHKLGHYNEQPLIRALGLEKKIGDHDGKPTLRRLISSWTEAELLKHLILFAIAPELNVNQYGVSAKAANMLAVAARHGVDAEAIAEQVKTDRAPKKAKAVQTSAGAAKAVKSGTCRVCGCKQGHGCVLQHARGKKKAVVCKWADKSKTLCTNPVCLKKIAAELKGAKPAKKAAAAKGGR